MKKFFLIFTGLMITLVAAGLINAKTGVKKYNYEKKIQQQSKDKPLKIIKKPQVGFDVLSKCSKDSIKKGLLVTMRVVFESSGQVGEAEVVRVSDCEYFNEETLRVAKKIKFKPAMRDGEPITITKILEYKAKVY